MAITEAQATTDLTNITYMYDKSVQQYNEMLEFAGDLGDNTSDDEHQMGAAGQVVLAAQATVASQYDQLLAELMREFQPVVGTSATAIDTALRRLRDYMELNSKNIKSRGVAYTTSSPVSFTGTGDQKLYVCSVEAGNYVNEAVTIETLRFELIRQAESLKTRGQEQYRVRGTGGRGLKSELDGRGRGISDTTIFAFEGGTKSNLVKNASFDLPVNGSGNDKIQFWTVESTPGSFTPSTTQTAKDRGATHRALEISGTGKIRFYFRQNDKALNRALPYIGSFRAYDDCTTGTVVCRVGSAGATTWVKSYSASGSTSWSENTLDPDTQYAWADNFDTDGNPYIEFECTVAPSGGNAKIYIDDVLFRTMTAVGGRYVAIVSGLTDGVKGDYAEHACDLDYGTGSVELTGGGSGSVDGITVDGVEIMSGAEAYDTSLNQTAENVKDNINNHRSYPNYFATRSGATVTIIQEIPAEGTLTVTSSTTTITTTDTDVSGASYGKTADFICRRRGVTLKHASSATAGWGV